MSLFARLSNRDLEDLLAPPRLLRIRREPPSILLRWCTICAEWMREGSAALGRCRDCGACRE